MNRTVLPWTTALIKFQTASNIPAPYAYYYTIIFSWKGSAIKVKLDLVYLDRDELDTESILDEGFTLNDDYEWEGDMQNAWQEVLLEWLHPSKLGKENSISESENFIEIEFHYDKDRIEQFYPLEMERWDYFQQEILQAIYEISDRELPFEMTYLEIDHRDMLRIKVDASFGRRELTVAVNEADTQIISWEKTREIMQTVFRADFLAEYASESEPKKDGKYLNTGDGLWYKFGEALLEPTPKSKILLEIENLLDGLR